MAITGAIVGGVTLGAVAVSALSGGPDSPPPVAAPPPMPTRNDAGIAAAKKRSLQEQLTRRGRASTFLNPEAIGGQQETLG